MVWFGAKRMRRKTVSRGFSLVEGMVTTVIVLGLAAFAIPATVRSVRSYRLSSTTKEVVTLVQRARYEAIRRNRSVACRAVQVEGRWRVWIDVNGNGQPERTEPALALPAQVQFLGQGDVPGTESMGYNSTRVTDGVITFNSRGAVDFGAAAPAVLVMYLGIPGQRDYGFRAISLLPAGKTKIWKAGEYSSWHTD